MRWVLLFLVGVALVGCGKSDNYRFSDLTHYSLRSLLNESEFIGVGHLSAPDPRNFRTKIRIVRSLKGKTPLTDWNLDTMGATPHKELARHLVEGSPVVIFSTNQVMAVYVNRMFILSYGDPAVGDWSSSQLQGALNETFNGPALQLAQVCEKALKGELRPPPLCSGLPPIDTESVRKLPAWNEEVADSKLPPPFRKGAPPPVVPRLPEQPESTVEGLHFARFEGNVFISDVTAVETGVVSLPDTNHGPKEGQIGLRFRGFLEVPKDGDYAFSSGSEKGVTVELKFGSADVSTTGPVPEYVSLAAGKHEVTLKYLGPGGPGHLNLLWSGPDLPPAPIPAKAWSRYPN